MQLPAPNPQASRTQLGGPRSLLLVTGRKTPHASQCRGLLARAQTNIETECSADSDDTPSTSGRVQLTADRPGRGAANGLRLQRVERLGPESWAGVASVDRGGTDQGAWRTAGILYGGDATAIFSYALIGQLSHRGGVDPLAAVGTAAPFLIGWLISAQLTSATAPVKGPGTAAAQASQCWALAIPIGLGLRSLLTGHLPETSFAVVTLVYTFVTLVGWRAAFAAVLAGKDSEGAKRSYPARQQSSSKGNPLEFLQLLTSLVKRW